MAASDFPGGTVTFLFAGGVEVGHRDRLCALVERADDAVDEGCEAGFLAVFGSAAAAVAVAQEAQRALGSTARIGVHSGEAQIAVTIGAAARDGQVLLSAATASLFGGALPLRDAGGVFALVSGPALLERGSELAALRALAGAGGFAVIEGSAGIGKTRLLAEVRAAVRGQRVLSARGSELEREFAFGIVRQLFEPALAVAGPDERAELFAGAAGLSAAIFGERGLVDAPAMDDFAALHGLYWLAANMALNRPTVVLVDDLQWADGPSLRWLAHVARRLEGLPLAVIAATRPTRHGDPSALLTELVSDPDALVLRPTALGPDSVATMAREAFSAAPEPEFCAACLAATGGNPLYLRALMSTLAADGGAPTAAPAPRGHEVGPEPVARAVALRLARLPPSATAMVRAIAVLGPLPDVGPAAALAELDRPAATAAAAALGRAELLRLEPMLELSHPVVRAAVYDAIDPLERAELHRRAARLLAASAAEPERAAAHILFVAPAGDATVGPILRAAAARARDRGAVEQAALYLRRALAEEPPAGERGELLTELGLVEIGLDAGAATEHLQAAVALADVDRFPTVAAECGRVLAVVGRTDAAADLLDAVIACTRETRPDLAESAIGDFISATWWEPALYPRALAALEALDEDRFVGGLGSDVLLATLAQHAQRRFDRAASVSLARRALSSGLLLDRSSHALFYALDSLRAAGEFEAGAAGYGAALAAARRRGDLLHAGGLLSFRGWLEFERGDLRAAEPDLREGLQFGLHRGALIHAMYHAVFLSDFLLERGELAEAERVLALPGLGEEVPDYFGFAWFLSARGMLRLAQRNPQDALRDFQTIGRMASAVDLQ